MRSFRSCCPTEWCPIVFYVSYNGSVEEKKYITKVWPIHKLKNCNGQSRKSLPVDVPNMDVHLHYIFTFTSESMRSVVLWHHVNWWGELHMDSRFYGYLSGRFADPTHIQLGSSETSMESSLGWNITYAHMRASALPDLPMKAYIRSYG